MLLRAIIITIALMLGASSASAQCSGNPAAGRFCGNPTAGATLPSWATGTAMLDRAFGTTPGTILNRGSSAWTNTANPVFGANGGTGGSLTLNGATSGSAIIGVKAAAGTTTLNLPVGNGSLNNVLITDGAGNTSWVSAGGGTVSSVGLSLPGIFTVTNSPVTGTGTLTGTLNTQNANLIWAGPTTGAAATPAFRSLVGADLPNPSASTLGGIQSFAGSASQWIRSISTSGVPASSQPAFSDISGVITPGQCPNPSASTIGCVESYAAVAHQWINAISTAGVPSSVQPNFNDLLGNAALSQLPSISNNSVLGNNSGGTAIPSALTATNVLDFIATTQGDILYRNGSIWTPLPPGTNGQVLTTGGPAANPAWATITGTGTVTSVATNNGITGGTITGAGTIGLATIATGNALAYTGAGSGVPVATTPSALLDVIGSATGDILYRTSGSGWAVLAPGTNGQVLTQGASTPAWGNAGTLTNVTVTPGNDLISTGTCNISTSGTCTLIVEQMSPGGRLTLASGVPVMATSQTAATSLFYAPYTGKYVPIYNGTNMQLYQFTASDTDTVGLTLALGSNWAANSNYDSFAFQTGGTVSYCTGPDWSQGAVAGSNAVGSSTRGTGTGSTQLQLFKGFLTNQNSMTCRTSNTTTVTCGVNQCTFLGTVRTGAAGQVSFTYGAQGTAGSFNLWNAFNQASVCSTSSDASANWTYTTATIRQAHASTVNQFNFVTGLAQGSIDASYMQRVSGAAAGAAAIIGIALNSTTVFDKEAVLSVGAAGSSMPVRNTYGAQLGANLISANEQGDGTNANTFFGQNQQSLTVCMSY